MHFCNVLIIQGVSEKDFKNNKKGILNKISSIADLYLKDNLSNFEFIKINDMDLEYEKDEYKNSKSLQREFSSFHNYMISLGYKYNNKTKQYGELYNPNGICDYYSIGGIWEDSLMTKDGVMCDFEMIEKIDFKGMEDNCHNISYIVSSVITPDGEYHSRAFHEDEFEANFYNDFIKKYNKEGYAIAILDCHR